MEINQITSQVIGAAIDVHRSLGPGLLESVYEECMALELGLRGLSFERQRTLDINYKGHVVRPGYRIDLLIEGALVLEIKAVERLLPIHQAQILTYLRLGNWPVGLLINFHEPVLRSGIRRIVHNYQGNKPPRLRVSVVRAFRHGGQS